MPGPAGARSGGRWSLACVGTAECGAVGAGVRLVGGTAGWGSRVFHPRSCGCVAREWNGVGHTAGQQVVGAEGPGGLHLSFGAPQSTPCLVLEWDSQCKWHKGGN